MRDAGGAGRVNGVEGERDNAVSVMWLTAEPILLRFIFQYKNDPCRIAPFSKVPADVGKSALAESKKLLMSEAFPSFCIRSARSAIGRGSISQVHLQHRAGGVFGIRRHDLG